MPKALASTNSSLSLLLNKSRENLRQNNLHDTSQLLDKEKLPNLFQILKDGISLPVHLMAVLMT